MRSLRCDRTGVRPLSLTPILLSLIACGAAGGSSLTSPDVPTGTNSLSVVVFYDENANGLLDASEAFRVPGVVIEAGGRSARSQALTGRARDGEPLDDREPTPADG